MQGAVAEATGDSQDIETPLKVEGVTSKSLVQMIMYEAQSRHCSQAYTG